MNSYNQLAPYYSYLFEGSYEEVQNEEVDWLNEFFQANQISTVLDSSCGDGFHAIPLAQRGYHLTGSDISRGMIRQAKLNALQAGVHFPLHVLDFCELDKLFSPTSYEVVLALGHSLMHLLDAAKTQQALVQMKRVLKQNGLLILDFPDFESLENNRLSNGFVAEEDGKTHLFVSHWDLQGDIVYLNFYRIVSRGKRARTTKYTIPIRHWKLNEFQKLLEIAGFRIIEQEKAIGGKGHYLIAQS